MPVLTVLLVRRGLAARRGGRSSAGRHGRGDALQTGHVRWLYQVRSRQIRRPFNGSVRVKSLFLSVSQRCSGCVTQIRKHTVLRRDCTASSAHSTRLWWGWPVCLSQWAVFANSRNWLTCVVVGERSACCLPDIPGKLWAGRYLVIAFVSADTDCLHS